MDIYTFLVMLHVIGTILGTGGATVAELQIARALKDKRVSMDERALMHANYSMIRAGMAIVLVSVIGMFIYFQAQGSDALFTNQKLWIKELMFAMIFINAVALHKRILPLWLGASISFTSWWGATLLGLAGQLPYSFMTYFISYVIAIFAIAGLFHLLRLWSAMGILNRQTTIISFAIVLVSVIAVVYYLISAEQSRLPLTGDAGTETPAEYRTLTDTRSFDYPGGSHTYEFTVILDESGAITSIAAHDVNPENQGRIADFVTSVSEILIGTPLSEVDSLGVVGGSSLTTAAFNDSLAAMQQQL